MDTQRRLIGDRHLSFDPPVPDQRFAAGGQRFAVAGVPHEVEGAHRQAAGVDAAAPGEAEPIPVKRGRAEPSAVRRLPLRWMETGAGRLRGSVSGETPPWRLAIRFPS